MHGGLIWYQVNKKNKNGVRALGLMFIVLWNWLAVFATTFNLT